MFVYTRIYRLNLKEKSPLAFLLMKPRIWGQCGTMHHSRWHLLVQIITPKLFQYFHEEVNLHTTSFTNGNQPITISVSKIIFTRQKKKKNQGSTLRKEKSTCRLHKKMSARGKFYEQTRSVSGGENPCTSSSKKRSASNKFQKQNQN